jgi:uncharacterized membrane protein YebE (DUF533 family)
MVIREQAGAAMTNDILGAVEILSLAGVAYWNYQTKKLAAAAHDQSKNNGEAIQEIKVSMNGELAERIAVEVRAALLKGRAEGVASEQEKHP